MIFILLKHQIAPESSSTRSLRFVIHTSSDKIEKPSSPIVYRDNWSDLNVCRAQLKSNSKNLSVFFSISPNRKSWIKTFWSMSRVKKQTELMDTIDWKKTINDIQSAANVLAIQFLCVFDTVRHLEWWSSYIDHWNRLDSATVQRSNRLICNHPKPFSFNNHINQVGVFVFS